MAAALEASMRPIPPLHSALAIFAALVLSAGTAAANDTSFLGARTLQPGSQTAYATVGIPDLEMGVTWGLNSLSDITPKVRLQFGRGTRVGGGGLALGAALRMRLARMGGWMLAVVAEPEIQMHLFSRGHPPVAEGEAVQSFAISPLAGGIVVDKEVLPGVRFVAGLKVPLTFYVAPTWVVNVPLVAELGCEAKIADNLYLVTRIDGGVDFYGPGGESGSELYFRGRLGLGWAL